MANTMESFPVAREIIRQLGGNGFYAMIGASKVVPSEKSVTIYFKANAIKKIKYVRITLDPFDTYTVEFLKMYAFEEKVVSRHVDVYCDELVELFERVTGLVARMPKIIFAR